MDISFAELYEKAKSVLNPRRLSEHAEAGGVGAALLSAGGNVYLGACIDTGSSMGFCAEHAAAGAMVTAGESQVLKMVADWGAPLPLSPPLNSPCPEDAIEISRDGKTLYVLFTQDLIGNLTPEQVTAAPNGTYRLARSGGSAEFSAPVFFDLGQGVDGSLDGELSFSPDGGLVYFHSLRPTNTGYRQDPAVADFLDIYVAELVAGVPGPGRNLGYPVNSVNPDGEHALHPDGVTLYFSSPRAGGLGGSDILTSRWDGRAWSEPVNLGAPVNSAGADLQPAFTVDGNTMYFVSDRDPALGMAIYRTQWLGERWGEPELVISGIAGEPSLTGDGSVLYFVHVLSDGDGIFDADIWVTQRVP